MTRVPILLVGMLWVGAGSGAGTQGSAPNPSLVRVFVQTDDSGEETELAARRQSVRDLSSALASKKKSLALVETDDLADIVIEVEGRGVTVPKIVIGIGARPGQPPGAGGPVRVVALRVTLTWIDQSVKFTNRNKAFENPRGWKSAADDIADQIDKWIGQRRGEIVKNRG